MKKQREQIFAALLFGVAALVGCASKSTVPEGWAPAWGNLWTGVLVCTKDKTPYFKVIGGNNKVTFADGSTGRGIKVLMSNGEVEWRNRDDIVKAGDTFIVLKNDPAIAAQQWKVIEP